MTKTWKAVRADGRMVISGMIAETAEEAAKQTERALKGRPGGRHELYEKWDQDGRLVVED